MKLWRAVSKAELDKLIAGKTIKPINDIAKYKNSWAKPVVTFFGTANNAVNWFNELTHDCVMCIGVPNKLVQCGKGRYPDFGQPLDPISLFLFGSPGAMVWVKEYGLSEYSRNCASIVAVYEVERGEKMEKYLRNRRTGEILQVDSVYDDLVEGGIEND